LTKMGNELHYDFQSFLISNGNITDKLRLISTGYKIPSDLKEQVMEDLMSIMNANGGIPFGFKRGAPSSTKETAELLSLISTFQSGYEDTVKKMIGFLVSRQKNDGGFGESLKIDPHIEDKWGSVGRDWYPVGTSITWLTGKALEALCLVNFEDSERLERARDFLLETQYEDGNWPDFKDQNISDPLGTGNILLGLDAVGVESSNKVIVDGRAALLQHLSDCIEAKSIYDLADVTAIGTPKTAKEKEVIQNSIELIVATQKEDGGWAPIGSKKSDPELSSILLLEFKRAHNLL
ncbi:MAG: terpene cyclase/mutase family protein, partial [Candidatus Thorarchaeota archaeon]|nr:terpene cyclase/mutase family protein [Candidatus Thorarchaeota archaeon]